jgi:hypothetical protein
MKWSLAAAGSLILAMGLAAPALADDPINGLSQHSVTVPQGQGTPGSDTFVILVSDTSFGPDMQDADIAARFYCSTRGKLTTFIAKEHPPELRTQVFQQWSSLTYRCVSAATSSAQ